MPAQVWNLCVVALFAALVGSAAAAGGAQLERPAPASRVDAGAGHDSSSAAGGGFGALAAAWRRRCCMGAGSGCRCGAQPMRWPRPWLWGWPLSNWARCWPARAMGPRTAVRWAVTYTDPLAARWSGTPLGIPLHPVQAYAALAFLTLSILLLVWLPATAAAGRCGRVVAAGSGRGGFCHRVLARSRGARRAAGRRAGWAAGGGGAAGAGWRAGAAGTTRPIESCGIPPSAERRGRMGHRI